MAYRRGYKYPRQIEKQRTNMGIQIRNICFEDLLMSALLGEKKKDKKEIDTKNLV